MPRQYEQSELILAESLGERVSLGEYGPPFHWGPSTGRWGASRRGGEVRG